VLALRHDGLDTISIIEDEWIRDSGSADEWYCDCGTAQAIVGWRVVEQEIGWLQILAAGMSVAGGVTAMIFWLLKRFMPLFPNFDSLE
jgi:hypothetical protein